jgi:carboxynorspermidine decarboxylase
MDESLALQTPVFVCDMAKLEANVKALDAIQRECGVKILLALKGFSLYQCFSLMAKYLCGTSVSSYNEARLSYETFGKEIHSYLPAFKAQEIDAIAHMSDTLIFNSLSQYERFYPQIKTLTSCGLRVNLELPFDLPTYCNPNRKQSRLGVLGASLATLPEGIEGLHVHALCSGKADAFEVIINALEKQFSSQLKQLKWINFGGGHALTCEAYDRMHLIEMLKEFQQKYPHLTLYMEPSEAIVHEAGVLVASVLDIVHNDIDIAILDISIEVHMLDVMMTHNPPRVRNSVKGAKHLYQLAGVSCAAGDIIGTYGFEKPLHVNDQIVFENQMAYSMVKSTFFNGINPANIALINLDGETIYVKERSYEDYLHQL